MFLFSRSHGFCEAPSGILRKVKPRGIPILAGAVLLTAAALKTHQLATGPTSEDSLFTSRWFLMALVEFEWALGLWLLSGVYKKQARIAALMTFAGFSLMSLYQALTGAPSCGCFGKLSIKPWYSVMVDLLAAASLWRQQIHSNVNICDCSRGGTERPFTLLPCRSIGPPLLARWHSGGDCHE